VIFRTDNIERIWSLEPDPHPIRRVRVGGVPEYPVYHTLNFRERSLVVSLEEFLAWQDVNRFDMVEFFNSNPDLRQRLIEQLNAGTITDDDVLEWIRTSERDCTPSDISYGFKTEADRLNFRMRWF
jgi:hypothetical protein